MSVSFFVRPHMAHLVLALLAVFGLVCILYPSRLPVAHLWYDHADTLIMEGIARNLWRGGSLLDWRLTQAPYQFPDIALSVLLSPLLPLGSVAVWVHALNGVLGAYGWWRLGRAIGVRPNAAFLAPLAYSAIFLASVLGPAFGSEIAVYFGLPGHHSAIGSMSPFALLALLTVWRSFQPTMHVGFGPVLASVTFLFAIAISDGLFVLGILLPVAIVFLITVFRPARFGVVAPRSTTITFVVLLAILALTSAWAGKLLVFDSREGFKRWAIAHFLKDFPQPTLDSILAFARFPFESSLTATLMVAWLIALAYATTRVWAILFGRQALAVAEGTPVAERLLLQTSILGGLVVIASQVGIGLFVFPAHSRQLAGFLISALALAPLLLVQEGKAWPIVAVPVAAAGLLAVYWYKVERLPDQAYAQQYVAVVRCLDDNFPRGADYAADFWLKVPIDFWSQGRFRGVTSIPGDVGPFTNGQNVTQMRLVRPVLAITRSDHNKQFVDAYGEPSRTIECPFGIAVLDYSHNETFKERHAAIAKAAQ